MISECAHLYTASQAGKRVCILVHCISGRQASVHTCTLHLRQASECACLYTASQAGKRVCMLVHCISSRQASVHACTLHLRQASECACLYTASQAGNWWISGRIGNVSDSLSLFMHKRNSSLFCQIWQPRDRVDNGLASFFHASVTNQSSVEMVSAWSCVVSLSSITDAINACGTWSTSCIMVDHEKYMQSDNRPCEWLRGSPSLWTWPSLWPAPTIPSYLCGHDTINNTINCAFVYVSL